MPASATGPYARVYIQLRSRSLERPFDYRIPERLLGKAETEVGKAGTEMGKAGAEVGKDGARVGVGATVLVPFGRQKVLGLVVDLTSRTDVPASRLVDIETVLDFPRVPEPLIRLALWVSEYYYCPPATALGLVLPPGGLPALVKTKVAGKITYSLKPPSVRPKVARFVTAVGPASTDVGVTSAFRRTAARQRLLDLMATGVHLPVSDALKLASVGRSTLNSLVELGLLKITEKQIRRDGMHYYGGDTYDDGAEANADNAGLSRAEANAVSAGQSRAEADAVSTGQSRAEEADAVSTGQSRAQADAVSAGQSRAEADAGSAGGPGEAQRQPGERLVLNKPQGRALAAIISRLEEPDPQRRSQPILLEGVAGAGKTEVYLRAIEATVAAGGAAIVLVPEISLTHQAVKRFHRRFGERVGVLHSGLSLGERYDEFMRIRRGEVDVVIGPRSALFAPVPRLRLIILDEENDGSYKQDNDPRYDARRVALERARLEGAVVIYGSATPSLESYHQIVDRFILPERATGAAMPAVEIVDMLEENNHIFSARLLDELDRNIAAGNKSILLLNSRGFARYMQCGHCGHVWKCDNCEVSLTIHNRIARLLCHHCGHAEEMPGFCPECRSTGLRRWGVGTEQLEQETRRLFPAVPVFRLDADTARGYGEGPRILEEFGRAGRSILLGTQMVAKGHHFPEVTLAAVINADLGLAFPEFRAEERTFSLLVQLAGRSGRAGLPGKVMIQTWNGDIECIRMAAEGATQRFYDAELGRRRRLGYPPFCHLINVQCLSHVSGRPYEAAAFLLEKLAPALIADEALLGPADLFRLKGWSRSHILVKTGSIEKSLAAMKPVIEHYREPYRSRGVRIVVDVDPQWLS